LHTGINVMHIVRQEALCVVHFVIFWKGDIDVLKVCYSTFKKYSLEAIEELYRIEDLRQARGEGVFRRCSTSVKSFCNIPQNVSF